MLASLALLVGALVPPVLLCWWAWKHAPVPPEDDR